MWLFLLFDQQIHNFSLVWTIFTKIHGKFMYNTSESDSFHDQGRYGIKRHFQHLLAGRTC